MVGVTSCIHLMSLPTSKNIIWHLCIYPHLTHINIYVRKNRFLVVFFSIFLSNVAIIHYKNSSRHIHIQVFYMAIYGWMYGCRGGNMRLPTFLNCHWELNTDSAHYRSCTFALNKYATWGIFPRGCKIQGGENANTLI